MTKNYYVYIIRCADHSLYTGWTVELKKRIALHARGLASKYTRSRLPVELAYAELCASKSEAMKREHAIKKLTRQDKEKLIATLSSTELKSFTTVAADS